MAAPAILMFDPKTTKVELGTPGRIVFTHHTHSTGSLKVQALDGAGVWHDFGMPIDGGGWTFSAGDRDDRAESRR